MQLAAPIHAVVLVAALCQVCTEAVKHLLCLLHALQRAGWLLLLLWERLLLLDAVQNLPCSLQFLSCTLLVTQLQERETLHNRHGHQLRVAVAQLHNSVTLNVLQTLNARRLVLQDC